MNPIRYFTNKQSRTIELLFLLSFFFPVTTYSIHHPNTSLPVGKSNQFPAYTWKNLTLQGKPTAVACILTDSRGLMWLGTHQGLYCYDGITLHPTDAAHTHFLQINAMVEGENELYLGTSEGLFRYDFQSNLTQQVSPLLPKEIRSLLRIGPTLWIGSLFGAYTYDTDTQAVTTRNQGLPHPSVYALLKNSQGQLYAGTFEGLALWENETQIFQPVTNPSLTRRFINCLCENPSTRNMYVGCEGALLCYSPQQNLWKEINSLRGKNIKSLAHTPDGRLLVGSDNGLFLVDGTTILLHLKHTTHLKQSLPNDEIGCIHSPQPGWLAVGHGKGFSLATHSPTVRSYPWHILSHTEEGNDLYALFRDSQGMLWMGGTNGLLRYDSLGFSRWYHPSTFPPSLAHKRIRSIQEDKEGNLWLTTDAGLQRYDRTSDRFDSFVVTDSLGHYPSNWVYSLVEEPDSFWIGSYLGGLHHIAKHKFHTPARTLVADASIHTQHPVYQSTLVPLKNNLVSHLLRDTQGRLWMLFFKDPSLYCLTPGQGCIRYPIQELTGEIPSQIILDAAQRLWCTVRGGAVVCAAAQPPRFLRFPETESNEDPIAVGRVGNDLWISTHNNVWKIDGHTEEISLLPLPQRTFTAIYHDAATGLVYLGGTDELTTVDPEKLKQTADSYPKLVLAQRGKEPISWADLRQGIRPQVIPHQGELTLTVSPLNYTPEALPRYAYRLIQDNKDSITSWKYLPAGSNQLTLSNLASGNHHLQIRSVGISHPLFTIPLQIARPWYWSNAAIGIYLLGFLASLAILLGYLNHRQQRQLQEAERKRALETAERKLTFLASVSHDLTIPLSQMTDRIGRLKLQTQEAETRRGLETVYDQTLHMGQQLQNALELPEVVHIRPIANVPLVEAESTIEKQLTCVARLIEEHLGNPDLNVQFLSEKSGIAPKNLYRLLKKYQGATPVDYIRQIRLQKAALLLEQHHFTVAEVCYLVGFNTPSYFAKCFQKQYGKKPSEYGNAD